MTNWAVLSTDHNQVYAYFTPLTALTWKHVCGFESLVYAIGPVDPWVIAKTRETGAVVERLAQVRKVSTASEAQFCRLFGYLSPHVKPDDYLIMGDVDGWILHPEPYLPSGLDIDLFFANWMAPVFPMGYVGAKASTWRQMIGVGEGCVENALCHVLKIDPVVESRKKDRPEDPLYNCDEAFVTSKIRAWPGYPERCRIVPRVGGDVLNDRLDRIRWPEHPRIEGKADAHLPRPGWQYWPSLRELLEQILPADALFWADRYQSEWMARMEQP